MTKLTNFGAFVQLEADLEGLLHISELSDQKIKKPQDVVKVDDELEVKILKVDSEARKIGLSLRRAQWAAEEHGGPAAGSAGEPVQQTLDIKPIGEQARVQAGEVSEQPTASMSRPRKPERRLGFSPGGRRTAEIVLSFKC